jgi:hypothetical protein
VLHRCTTENDHSRRMAAGTDDEYYGSMESRLPADVLPRRLSRRQALQCVGHGFGSLALAALLQRAKRVVQLFMAGGASHIDLFDFKPELVKRHGQPSDFGEHVEAFQDGLGPWLKPLWDFKPYGQCGKLLSEVVAPLGDVVDESRSSTTWSARRASTARGRCCRRPASTAPASPAWAAGSATAWEPEREPADVRRAARPPRAGLQRHQELGLAFLPAQHQGTVIYPGSETPIADLFPDERATSSRPPAKRRSRDGAHPAQPRPRRAPRRRPAGRPHQELRAGREACSSPRRRRSTSPRSRPYPQAVRPRSRPTEFDKEINAVEETDYFGRKCLVARRLLERGVRFVQIWSGNDNGFPRRNWDSTRT